MRVSTHSEQLYRHNPTIKLFKTVPASVRYHKGSSKGTNQLEEIEF